MGGKGKKMGDFASSTITDLRQIMMNGAMENLVDSSNNAAAAESEDRLTYSANINLMIPPQNQRPRFSLNNTISGSSVRFGALNERLRKDT